MGTNMQLIASSISASCDIGVSEGSECILGGTPVQEGVDFTADCFILGSFLVGTYTATKEMKPKVLHPHLHYKFINH